MNTHRSLSDWALFLLLSSFWASAFAMTKVAVDGLPASVIIPLRLGSGALCMWILMWVRGEKLPPFSNRHAWLTIIGLGTIGTALPFYLITLGQKTIDSSLAALLISGAPLFTAVIAHFRFADEQITGAKVLGLIVGFAGVALLLGPDALKGFGNANLIAQLLVLGGAFCYAVNSIIARAGPDIPATVMPVGFLTVAALFSLPMLAVTDWSDVHFTTANTAAVIGLGIVPTAAAGILLMYLVARTSATFIALTGYVIPILTAILGYFAFRETQGPLAIGAFILILAGVWLSQGRIRAKARR